ncbi:fumarate hydratase [PVC group bacterium (ex Bugula neritina AB1)]|nr:fumarate hydratase [PVC group bacterium (ex Bugula neritina AB1)]
MNTEKHLDSFVELIRLASTDLPHDVEEKIVQGLQNEEKDSSAYKSLKAIVNNISIAREQSLPMCQDTGTNIYFIKAPYSVRHADLVKTIKKATTIATEKGYLRPNTVDTLTGKNLEKNWGEGQPFFHIEQVEADKLEINLILKGGGCENVGAQYSLPDASISAGRDISGIKKCILDAAFKAQGRGCAPGILGVGIGGDRATSYLLSKEQFTRTLNSSSTNPLLASMEKELYAKCNQLEIGPMGYGGKTTVLGVLIGSQTRIPASYFVSISYMCWTFRRRSLIFENNRISYE